MSELDRYFELAVAGDASDLFLSAGKPPSLRRCGEIETLEVPPISAAELDAFRATLLTPEEEAGYRERGSCDLSYTHSPRERFRINFFATLNGPALAARPIRLGGELFFPDLNLPDQLRKLCEEPRGLILVSGSTGSGKSTTLAAMVNHLNRNFRRHILTIEDPIEFLHEDEQSLVNQREIHSDVLSFGEALRSALRENPDVIVIGEMRDLDTMQSAINAALTGHLVISTVHTASAVQAVERIVNLFPEFQREQAAIDLGASLLGIVSQRLLPRQDRAGMIPAVELLLGTPSICKLIADRNYAELDTAHRRGSDSGMCTFIRAIFQLYREQKVSLEAALEAVTNRDEFRLLLRGMESGVESFRNHYTDSAEDEHGVDMHQLLRCAVKNGASDLLLSTGAFPTLRINGQLRALELPELAPGDIQRLLFSIISPRQRIELEEQRELDFALAVTFHEEINHVRNPVFRFRINSFYQRGNVAVVARVVPEEIPLPQTLGLPEVLLNLIEKQQGLILITGPTGSGKSTTMASLIDRINRTRTAHIITIEDPIEFVHHNQQSLIEQRELHADTLSFASALKYALRQDPDVILLGEMRDPETIAAALTAAETGHLVLATIHTNSAAQTVDRIIDSFPASHQNQIRQQLAGVLLGVVSQRLLTRIQDGGRIAAFEIMVGTPPVKALIRENKTHMLQGTLETSQKDGMITLEHAMNELYHRGLVSRDEVDSFTVSYRQGEAF